MTAGFVCVLGTNSMREWFPIGERIFVVKYIFAARRIWLAR